MPERSHRRCALCSAVAICCPVLLLGMFLFLATRQAQAFNEHLFARYYTLGMLLMLGFYSAIGLGLVGLGFILGVIACIRREAPFWLPWLAVTVNALAPLAVLLYLT